ncbi:MAG: maleylacetate reductase [Pseudomonadota bacterium]
MPPPPSFFLPEFRWQGAAVSVRFAPGALRLVAEEVTALNGRRALVLTTLDQADSGAALAAHLGGLAAGQFAGAVMHTPADVTDRAMAVLADARADCLVAIGGGSTIGLCKALALRTGLPQIVVPTTFAGSEATPILGQTENGEKTTLTDARVRPAAILYDPDLICTLPPAMAVSSALNAIAHAAEGLYARDRNPVSSLMAVEGIRAFVSALPAVLADPANRTAWAEGQYGAWLCGTVLGQVGMALHHKLCHVLGGAFNLPHAETHAVILPHAIACNEAAVPDLLAPLAALFGTATAAEGLARFARSLGAPTSLRGLGLREDQLDRAEELALQRPYWNPRPLDPATLRGLLRRAWAGDAPTP